jgi:GTP-binding protein
MAFRDVLDITVTGGKGGDGGLSFMRLKYIPKGGPDGGHGGRGGTIFLRAIDDVTSLDKLVGRSQFKAETGSQGEGRDRAGKAGVDLYIEVPVGTRATDIDTGELVADLLTVGEEVVVAAGGVGGRGNASFANSVRRAPRFAELGTQGQRRRLRLELMTIADVGLVGYPNAGKSSLLAALSNSRPVIADYPFTTLSPNLGTVDRHHERFTMADIPGIIEDAHLGKGLGLDFLRHISRTRLLVYVLDVASLPVETLAALQHELDEYDATLRDRPSVIALNKIDLVDEDELAEAEAALAEAGMPIVPISTVDALGLDDLRDTLFDVLPPRPEPIKVVHVPAPRSEAPVVKRDMSGTGWVVTGTEIEAVVGRFDPANQDAVAYLQHHFKSFGIDKLLRRAGVKTGDEVHIGAATFDYLDDTARADQLAEDVALDDWDTSGGVTSAWERNEGAEVDGSGDQGDSAAADAAATADEAATADAAATADVGATSAEPDAATTDEGV